MTWGGDPIADFDRSDDLDGDGLDDLRVVDDRVRIKRPGGDVVLTVPGARFDAIALADLDGDGGSEVGIIAYDDSPDATSIASDAWLVAWDAPVGEYDPTAVGVALPAGWPSAVADRDGDGTDDVIVRTLPLSPGMGTTTLLSGAAILAGGVPADLSASTGLWQLPGNAVVVGDLGGAIPAILVLEQPYVAEPYALEPFTVRVVEEDLIATLWSGPGEPANETSQGAALGTGPDGRFVAVGRGGRSGSHTWYWSLDDPCRQLDPSPVPPAPPTTAAPATPATPTDGQPRYTG